MKPPLRKIKSISTRVLENQHCVLVLLLECGHIITVKNERFRAKQARCYTCANQPC